MNDSFNNQFDHFFQQTTVCLDIAEELERSLAEIRARSIKQPSPAKKHVQGLPYSCRPHKRETSLLKLIFRNPEPITSKTNYAAC